MNLSQHIQSRGGEYRVSQCRHQQVAVVKLPVPIDDSIQVEVTVRCETPQGYEEALVAAFDKAQYTIDQLVAAAWRNGEG